MGPNLSAFSILLSKSLRGIYLVPASKNNLFTPISILTLVSTVPINLTPISANLWKNPRCLISQIRVLKSKGMISLIYKIYIGLYYYLGSSLFLLTNVIISCKVAPLKYGST